MAKISINLATGSLQPKELILGIDLGTTNSLIAMIHPDSKRPQALKDIDDATLVPSVIHIKPDHQPLVGYEAIEFLKTDPANTIHSIKRLMGRSYPELKNSNSLPKGHDVLETDTDTLIKVKLRDKYYTPIELSSYILAELKKRAEHVLKIPVSKCVITVPAYFNDTQRQATRDAGKLAGLDVLRIINEPTAASLAYGIGTDSQQEKCIAVYDLGGGTFDISILQLSQGVFDVLSTHGDTQLGGDDFDHALMQLICSKCDIEINELTHEELQQIRLLSEQTKKTLSLKDNVDIIFKGKEATIHKVEFEHTISALIEKTISSCKQALEDSGKQLADIDRVVMVGGSTRVPAVKKAVKDFFQTELFDELNPDEVVALGAAIQADILAGNTHDLLLLDVTPLSLGIETMGGLMDVLIPRNSKIPTKAARQYTTQKDGQSGMNIAVYQGERDLVKDNRKLAEFILKGIPAMPAGLAKIEILFTLNADGILHVKATELRSSVQQSIEVKPQFGLTDEEVEKMLMDSITHAKTDMHTRALTEAISEAEQLLYLTENFLHKNASYLHDQEIAETYSAIDALKSAITLKEKEKISVCIEALNNVSRPYAERVMDEAIALAMRGKKIEE